MVSWVLYLAGRRANSTRSFLSEWTTPSQKRSGRKAMLRGKRRAAAHAQHRKPPSCKDTGPGDRRRHHGGASPANPCSSVRQNSLRHRGGKKDLTPWFFFRRQGDTQRTITSVMGDGLYAVGSRALTAPVEGRGRHLAVLHYLGAAEKRDGKLQLELFTGFLFCGPARGGRAEQLRCRGAPGPGPAGRRGGGRGRSGASGRSVRQIFCQFSLV